MGRHVDLTFKEERLLETLRAKIEQGYELPVEAAARELRIAVQTVYTTLHRIRNRYNASLEFGRKYRSWRRKLRDQYL